MAQEEQQKIEFEKTFGFFAEESGLAEQCRRHHLAHDLNIVMTSLREWLFSNYTLAKKGEEK